MIDEYIRARQRGGRFAGQIVTSRTLNDYETILRNVERFMEKPLHEWSYEDADRYVQERVEQGKKANTINLEISVCRGFFDWYYKTNNITELNPFDGIARRPKDTRYPTILSKEEIQKLFPDHPLYGLMFRIMYYGGLRIGEARMLQKEHVQDRGLLITGKGNRQRFVPIHPKVLGEIKAHIAKDSSDSRFVFHHGNPHEPISERRLQRRFKAALKDAGISENVTPHNLRHTCASHMYAGSLDVVATKDLLGHQNIATTMIYVKLHREDVEDAYQKAFDY